VARPTTPIADSPRYFQQRVALYAQALGLFYAGLLAYNLIVTLFRRKALAPQWVSGPRFGAFLVAVMFGLMWLLASRGEHSLRKMRAMEVGATLVACTLASLAGLKPPIEGLGTLILVASMVLIGCIVVMRAAIVPSTPWLTFVISLAAIVPVVMLSPVIWDIGAPLERISAKRLALAHTLTLSLFFVAVATIISKIIHGLRVRVRDAMRLGQYTLEEKLGEGAMGEVYRARHSLLRRPTAVKLLPPDKAGEKAIARFEREVQQTSRLNHPNTVAIFDYGHTEEGVFYYAMEYLEGIGLDGLVELSGPLSSGRVIHIMAQTAEALAEAHGLGLIHRDVKPANIVLCHRGGIADLVKVLDFGLVKDIAAPEKISTSAASTMTGTPQYMAPESINAPVSVDARADIYALGAVAYFLLTGVGVFEAPSTLLMCSKHLNEIPVPPSQRGATNVDADLERLVLRCLEKKREDRPQTALELRDALLACEASGDWPRAHAEAWWQKHAEGVQRYLSARRASGSQTASETAITVALSDG
jgi:hypothetical protein